MAITTVSDLKAGSLVDAVSGCWNWRGAHSDGQPRIHCFDYRSGDKKTISGPTAVIAIAFERAPRGVAFRCCGNRGCVSPFHIREAPDKLAMFAYLKSVGALKGRRNAESQRACAAMGRAAQGIKEIPRDTVLAIWNHPDEGRGTGMKLARLYGVSNRNVSKIRRGVSHRHITGLAA